MTQRLHTVWCTFLLCLTLFPCAWGDCGPPPIIPHTLPVEKTSGTVGEAVVYACDRDTGYYEIPDKSTTITCQIDDTWTDIEEFCIRGCGVLKRLDFAEPNPKFLTQNIFLPNATVSYSCRPGYVRAPGTKATITCLDNFTWSVPDTFCTRKSCGNPGEVDNGDIHATDFYFGSRVTYTCIEGYRLQNKRNYRDCLADGTWSNSPPQCEAAICAAPFTPDKGSYYPQKDEYQYLDSVTFSCTKLLVVDGSTTSSCTATGDWSSPSPTCKDVNCIDPVVINSKRLSGFIGPYRLNSAISFECVEGFLINGSSSISCNIDSQWIPAIPTCESASCGDPGHIANSKMLATNFLIGSKATYSCNDRYTLISSVDFRICQKNGTWSPPPVCAAICAGSPRPPPNAIRDETSTSHRHYLNGTVLHYTCIPGFLSSPDKERVIVCRGHEWTTPDEKSCTRISCGKPEDVDHGNVYCEDYYFGSRATYTCEKGYKLNSTLTYRECQADGTWTEKVACIESTPIWIIIIGSVLGFVVLVAVFAIYKYLIKKKKEGVYYCDVRKDKFAEPLEL